MQHFYEYSFSTAAIGADTQLAQSFEVLQNTCSSAKTARFDKEKITPVGSDLGAIQIRLHQAEIPEVRKGTMKNYNSRIATLQYTTANHSRV